MLNANPGTQVKTAQREIKFRAWYPKAKEWASGYSLSSYSENLDLRKIHTDGNMDDEEPVWSQFTGLHDKNGREICEGDVLQRGEQKGQVVYSNDKMAFLLRGIEDWDIYFPASRISESGFVVIGNIYENPDLINERN